MRRGAAVLALLLVAAGCGGSSKHPVSTPIPPQPANAAAACSKVKVPAPRHNRDRPQPTPLAPGKTYTALVATNCGSFRVTLDLKQSPHAVASFVALARASFFDRTIFHRIVPGFVIQGGDPTQTGTGGPGYSTVDTPPKDARYEQGVVAMAKTQSEAPGTAGSQFFVVTAADAGLPPDYAIVGRVTSGLPVVLRIGTLGSVKSEQPTRIVEILSVRVSVS
ncbi:MAG TPA: peptidylprolyl isomerase [Gaiellaceae bacterium]